jgi:hypothetical protein
MRSTVYVLCYLYLSLSRLITVLGSASDAVRDQVMRHNPFTGVFNKAYINSSVRFNIQDAFLESDISDDGLTRAFTYMSIRCNPGTPKEVPKEVMDLLLAADPDIVDLERRFKGSHTQIKWKYKFIKRAPKRIKKEHDDLRKQLTNTKKSLRDEIENTYRKDYFFRIYNEIMKRQLEKTIEEEDVEPIIQHQLEERTRLQQILCDFSRDLKPQDIVSRKVLAIDLIVALASRQEFQARKPRLAPASQVLIKKEPDPESFLQPHDFPLVCQKTQYIICIGNEQLLYKERTCAFRRVSHMMDHIENLHLSKQPANQRIICHHPVYKAEGLVLNHVMHFKHHVATVYRISLRPGVFPG